MKKAWLMVMITILAALTCAISFLKVPPTMVLLMDEFGVNLTIIGLAMTIPTISQLVVFCLLAPCWQESEQKKRCISFWEWL